MPWNSGLLHCGFSEHTPWLPFGNDHSALAIDLQDASPASMLNATRRFVSLRRSNEALRSGDIRIINAQGELLVFERSCARQKILCVFNMGNGRIGWEPEKREQWRIIESLNNAEGWKIGPYGAVIADNLS
jgi:alpha-glucosidase